MTWDEAFRELGVARGADKAAVRKAYLRLLKTRSPERDPEGFMRLRSAYEMVYRRAGAVPVMEAPPLVEPVVEAAPLVVPVMEAPPLVEPVVEAAPLVEPVVELAPLVESTQRADEPERKPAETTTPDQVVPPEDRDADGGDENKQKDTSAPARPNVVYYHRADNDPSDPRDLALGIIDDFAAWEAQGEGTTELLPRGVTTLLLLIELGAWDLAWPLATALDRAARESANPLKAFRGSPRWALTSELWTVRDWLPWDLLPVLAYAIRQNDFDWARSYFWARSAAERQRFDWVGWALLVGAPTMGRMLRIAARPPPPPPPRAATRLEIIAVAVIVAIAVGVVAFKKLQH